MKKPGIVETMPKEVFDKFFYAGEDIFKKGCKRRYILSKTEIVLYIAYIKELQDKTGIDTNTLFDLTPINPNYMFPLSFVIYDPLEGNRARALVQPKKVATKDDMYGLYTDDKEIVSQFVGTFLAYSNLLSRGGA